MKILIIGGEGTIGKRVSDRVSDQRDMNGYVKSVEGKGNGEIIKMYDNC